MQHRGSGRLRTGVGLGAALLALLLPAAAAAAPAKPVADTGGASNVGQSTVTLNGAVNPKEAETTYFFQYGTTSLYGAQTPAVSAGSGNARVRISADVGGLAPATTYHYRLVAQNEKGLTRAATARSGPSASRSASRSQRRRTRSTRAAPPPWAGR